MNDQIRLGVSTLFLLDKSFDQMLATLRRHPRVKHWEIFDDGFHSLNKDRSGELSLFSRNNRLSFSVHAPMCDINIATLNKHLVKPFLDRLEPR